MSFSFKVKEGLVERYGKARHCNIAEIAAIINLCGQISERAIKVQTENPSVAKKFFALIKKTFPVNMDLLIRRNKQLHKNRTYIIIIADKASVNKILMATGLKDTHIHIGKINPIVMSQACCKRAYIRGAFLSAGSLNDPEKNYHLEFVNYNYSHAKQLMELINSFQLSSKVVIRKDSYILYLKEGEQIADLLNIIEAHVPLMEFENVRILKDMRNNVNRIVNCETANLNKTVSASVRQIMDINYIQEKKGLSFLPPQLEEIADLRLRYPDTSLKELGQMINPPVGKSGVNHRLRKISDIAQNLKEENYYGENIDC